MKRLNILFLIFSSLCLFIVSCCNPNSPVRYVNPLIGTHERIISGSGKYARVDRGQTYPLVGVPLGMNNWTPQTREGEKKGYPPYYYGDPCIQGFRNSHYMSGSAAKDYGTFTLMPVSGDLVVGPKERASVFNHEREVSSPMYYSVYLERYKILSELTGLSRSGMLRFTFQTKDDHYVVVEPNCDTGDGYIEIIPERNEIVGYNPVFRIYQGWGTSAGFCGYFVVVFDKVFSEFGVWENQDVKTNQKKIKGEKTSVGAFVKFPGENSERIQVRIGSSFTSIEEARKNLKSEIPQWNFDHVKKISESAWTETLSKIKAITAKSGWLNYCLSSFTRFF